MVKTYKGESIIEVLLAMTIFSVAAVSTVAAMSFSLYTAQADLEIAQARNELDAQAEALRFIHANYTASKTRGDTSQNNYSSIWQAIKTPAIQNSLEENPDLYSSDEFDVPSYTVCSNAYDRSNSQSIDKYNAFAVNTRILAIKNGDTPGAARVDAIISSINTEDGSLNPAFHKASTYPRFTYTNGSVVSEEEINDKSTPSVSEYRAFSLASSIEGLWIYGIPSSTVSSGNEPEYIDYYINTCWYPQGRKHAQTINTTIRLYNPDFNEIAVTEKPAIAVNYYYRDTDNRWTVKNTIARAKSRGEGVYEITFEKEKEPQIGNINNGYLFTGWTTATNEEATAIVDEDTHMAFRRNRIRNNTYVGLYCSDVDDPTVFHPECETSTLRTALSDGLIDNSGHTPQLNLVMVEKPPMDVAVILDRSSTMTNEIAGAKRGLSHLADGVYGETVGRMSLDTIGDKSDLEDFIEGLFGFSSNTSTIKLCNRGQHYQAGTCGENTDGSWNFTKNLATNFWNSTIWNLSTKPESWLYVAVQEKINELINRDNDPAYYKMVIVLTDTVPTSSAVSNYYHAYGRTYPGLSRNRNSVINNIASIARDNHIRIYVIQSYYQYAETCDSWGIICLPTNAGTTGSLLSPFPTWNEVRNAWIPTIPGGGNYIVPIKADEALGGYSGEIYGGSLFRYEYWDGKLRISSDNGNSYRVYPE